MILKAPNPMRSESAITIAGQNIKGISNIKTRILRYATTMVDDHRFMME